MIISSPWMEGTRWRLTCKPKVGGILATVTRLSVQLTPWSLELFFAHWTKWLTRKKNAESGSLKDSVSLNANSRLASDRVMSVGL
jgi:hypothetical protein